MRRPTRTLFAALLLSALLAGYAPRAYANWGVFIGVLPSPMHADEVHARLLVKSHIGAVCRAVVTYDGVRQRATVFAPLTIKSKAAATWTWHNRTRAGHAVATVHCIYKKVTLTSIAYITIKR